MSPTQTEELLKLAHDLRNSLSAIYMYAQVLEMSLEKLHLDDQQKLAQSITQSAKKMEDMIRERIDDVAKRQL